MHHKREHDIVENQSKTVKQEGEQEVAVKDIKEEDDDDYIEIEKVVDNAG